MTARRGIEGALEYVVAEQAKHAAATRHSAEIHADPALLAILTREPDGGLGPVPMSRGSAGTGHSTVTGS